MRSLKIILTALAALTISLSSCSNDEEPIIEPIIDGTVDIIDFDDFFINLIAPVGDIGYSLINKVNPEGLLGATCNFPTNTLVNNNGKFYYRQNALPSVNLIYPSEFPEEIATCWFYFYLDTNRRISFYLPAEITQSKKDRYFSLNGVELNIIKGNSDEFVFQETQIIGGKEAIWKFTFKKSSASEILKREESYIFDDFKSIWKKQIEIMRDYWGDEVTLTLPNGDEDAIVVTYNFNELEQKYCQ